MTRDLPTPDTPMKLGTRGSPLALAQAHETRDRLMAAHDLPETAFEIVVIQTSGDRIQDRALREIGGKGLFTKEIEDALIDGSIDIAVHSMKDVPTVSLDALCISAILPREDVRDAFVSLKFNALDDLPKGAVFGTSSLRRRAQLLAIRPDLNVVEFRGNVQTRLRKLDEGVADATLLARAGLNRLGHADLGTSIDTSDMLPAIAQGAVGVEQRKDNDRMAGLLAAIHDPDTATRVAAERAFLSVLDGSCRTPIAGLATLDTGGGLNFAGEVIRPDGTTSLRAHRSGPASDAAAMGADAAAELTAQGAREFY